MMDINKLFGSLPVADLYEIRSCITMLIASKLLPETARASGFQVTLPRLPPGYGELATGNFFPKVGLVKLVREELRIGLTEAKEMVDTGATVPDPRGRIAAYLEQHRYTSSRRV